MGCATVIVVMSNISRLNLLRPDLSGFLFGTASFFAFVATFESAVSSSVIAAVGMVLADLGVELLLNGLL
jgi:hypothetical protein